MGTPLSENSAQWDRSPGPPLPLRGREDETRKLERLVLGVRTGQARLLVVSSPAGTGVTRLVAEGAALATLRGFSVLDLSPGAFPAREPGTGHPHVAGVSALAAQLEPRVVQRLRQGPVLVTLDDAHRTPTSVLAAVSTVMAELGDLPVGWLITLHGDQFANAVLQDMATVVPCDWIEPLTPLSDDAALLMAADLLGAAPDPDVASLVSSAGATPSAVTGVVMGLLAEDHVQVVADVARLTAGPLRCGTAAAVSPQPAEQLPASFRRRIAGRLAVLSPEAQDVLQVAAVLGNGFAPDDLAEMLGKSAAVLLRPLREALAAGFLDADGAEFVFHREPVWRAVLGSVPAPMRSALHRQVATMLLGRESPDVVRIAVHLVHCARTGDARAVAIVDEAARILLPSSPEAAAALATSGLRITEPGEPGRRALGVTAAAALVRTGRLSEAVELAREFPQPDDPCHVLCVPSGDAHELSPELVLLTTLSLHDLDAAACLADQVLELWEHHSSEVLVGALTVRAMTSWREGRLDSAVDAAGAAVLVRGEPAGIGQDDPLWTKAWILTRLGRLDEALDAVDQACVNGVGVTSPVPFALRAAILLARGDVTAAEAAVAAGLAASDQTGTAAFPPRLGAVLVLCALRRGDLVAAADGLRRLEESVPTGRTDPCEVELRLIAGQVALAGDGPAAAIAEIRAAAEDPVLRTRLLLEAPTATAWCVRTAIAAGDPALAELLASAAEDLAAANPGHESVAAAAAHGRALLKQDVAALAELEAGCSDPWTKASLAEDIGSVHLETDRRQAVVALHRALSGYDGVEAEPDSARVRRTLGRLGARRRRPAPGRRDDHEHEPRPRTGWGSLTGAEQEVARLVADGLTNRQVARELFVSPHTVGFHLRQIYRKLAIGSRVDLARIAP